MTTATHLNDEEIQQIDDKEREEAKKVGLEKMRFQSIDRLSQRKLERKILQYKARQAMKFGEPESDEE